MADIIGVVSGVLGIVQFFQGLFPPAPSIENPAGPTNVRIAAGMNGNGLSSADGSIGRIKLWNEYQQVIGDHPFYVQFGQGHVDSGSFTDFTLDCQGEQPTYIQVLGADNAVCIAYITQTWPDGTQRGWSGDMGMYCNQSHWSYSNIIVSDDGHKPACTWLDLDHTNGIKAAAVQIHMQDFTNVTTDYSNDPNHYCSAPTMAFKDNIDDEGFWTSGDSKKAKSRRSSKKRSAAMSGQIIGSQDASHSALKLCQSDTSYGPDFVSFSEGVFCDMATKTPWPLCSDSVTDDCYHWHNHTLITGGDHKPMNYDFVQNWE